MKKLLLLTIIFTMISVFPNASYAQRTSDHGRSGNATFRQHSHSHRPNSSYYHRNWSGPHHRPYYRPYYGSYFGTYYQPWYGPIYRSWPRSYYIPAPVYIYPAPPVTYSPSPSAIVIPNQAYAYPDPAQPAPPPQPDQAAILQSIYFDLNKSYISPDAEKTLGQNFEWFRQNPGRQVSLQGNCDPRATEQYNNALGQRRAEAIKQYLVSLGIDAKLLKVISYGKERSTCKGKDASCWAKERRVDFIPLD